VIVFTADTKPLKLPLTDPLAYEQALSYDTNDNTVVQFDFVPKVEGAAFHACDSIIAGIVNETEATLGPGSNAGDPADTSIPAPPWWLIGLGAFGVLGLFGDVMTAVFGK
jgi:hypothetical protein